MIPIGQCVVYPKNSTQINGSDFTSHHMEQVAIDLKINLMFSKVGVPRGRGKIERFFQTVNQTFLEQLPGYINNNDTPSNLINFHNFEEKLRYFLIEDYNQKNIVLFIPRLSVIGIVITFSLICQVA